MIVRYIRVKTDTGALTPVASYSYGNLAILGPIAPNFVGSTTVTGPLGNQTVTLSPPTAGFPAETTFTIGFGGQTTAAIPVTTAAIPVTAAGTDVQTALVALSSVGSDATGHNPNAKVTGNAGGPFSVALQGALATAPAGVAAGVRVRGPRPEDRDRPGP